MSDDEPVEHPLWLSKEGKYVATCIKITGYRYPHGIAVYCRRPRHSQDRWRCDRHRIKAHSYASVEAEGPEHE